MAKIAEMRQELATDHELALLRRARTLTGPRLAAMMPAWLKRELANGRMPKQFCFVPDKAPVYQAIDRDSVASKNPGPDPFAECRGKEGSTAEYVRAYDAAVGLRSQEVVARVSPEVAAFLDPSGTLQRAGLMEVCA